MAGFLLRYGECIFVASYHLKGEDLTETMLVSEEKFVAVYNYQRGFEIGEVGHGRNRYVVRNIRCPPAKHLADLLPSSLAVTVTAGTLSPPVWIESSYHAQPTSALNKCSKLVCIAGGVGITAVLPVLRAHQKGEARLYWGVKHEDIVDATKEEVENLRRRGAVVQVRVVDRWDVDAVVTEEVLGGSGGGDIGVMVCGPPAMAGFVRRAVGMVAARTNRGVVFIDEAFSW